MPNWRQNLLSAGESLSLTRDKKKKEANGYSSSSLSRLSSTIVTSDDCQEGLVTRSRKSSQCVESVTETVCSFQYESKKSYVFQESDIDFSSFLTDSSSFADYEDKRGSSNNLNEPPYNQLKIDKVPYTNSVFYVSTKSEYEAGLGIPNSEVYFVDTLQQNQYGSDCLSTSTCDSFERCQFDCREFEPFSDTCCCDPNSEGVCTRSPKLLDSPEFCTSPIRSHCLDEDRLSNRSDMDGLDLTLFEPAVHDHDDCDQNSCCTPERDGRCVDGVLHILMGEPISNGEISL